MWGGSGPAQDVLFQRLPVGVCEDLRYSRYYIELSGRTDQPQQTRPSFLLHRHAHGDVECAAGQYLRRL